MRVALLALKNLIAVGPMSLEYAVVEKGLAKAVANRSLQARLRGRRLGRLCGLEPGTPRQA